MPQQRILIVEDETQVARVLESYVQRLGYEVVGVVDNGEAALRLAAAHAPSLALLDIELPGSMDGFAIAERLLRDFDIPAVFLTGRGDEDTLERVRKSGSFGYLLKPFRAEELKAALTLALLRHGREARLAQVERSFSAAIRSIADAVILTDKVGNITYLNGPAERFTGWRAAEAVGRKLDVVFQARNGGQTLKTRAWLKQAAVEGAAPEPPRELTLLPADKRELPIEVSAAPIRDDPRGALGAVFVFRDITERKRFEAELKKSQAELRSLAGHLELAREEERTRIAREIHDELGQMLTGFKMDLAWMEKKLSEPKPGEPFALLVKVQSMFGLLHSMVQTVRRISAELRPGVLDTLGLEAAVEWQVNDFQQRTGVRSSVTGTLREDALARPAATALFRVLQESLTNVVRHAKASRVNVNLEETEGTVTLQISDNGCGIAAADVRKGGTFGLLGMRERIAALGGECEICGEPGRGTIVRVRVPVQPVTERKPL
jgi:two-component system sensor histidine kinase UhpB